MMALAANAPKDVELVETLLPKLGGRGRGERAPASTSPMPSSISLPHNLSALA